MQDAVAEDRVERSFGGVRQLNLVWKCAAKLGQVGVIGDLREHLRRVDERDLVPVPSGKLQQHVWKAAAPRPDVEHPLGPLRERRELRDDVVKYRFFRARAVGIGKPDLLILAERIVVRHLPEVGEGQSIEPPEISVVCDGWAHVP